MQALTLFTLIQAQSELGNVLLDLKALRKKSCHLALAAFFMPDNLFFLFWHTFFRLIQGLC